MTEHSVQIRWQNFRSFKDTGWVKIKPLTVLIGPNNAGKTSILAPLLLLNQTLNSLDGDRALITRGDLIDVGNYKDFIHNHDTNLPLSLAIGFELLDSHSNDQNRVGTHPPGALEITLDHGEQQDIALKRYAVLDRYRRPLLTRTRSKSGSFTLRGGVRRDEMSRSEKKRLRDVGPTNFYFSPSPTLYRPSEGTETGDSQFTDSFARYIVSISHIHILLQRFFFPLGYLGPIRSWPQRYYEVLAEDRLTVGSKGEYTAAKLHAAKGIRTDLNEWVRKFGFGKSIEFSHPNDDFFEIGFSDYNGQVTNIVDAGFGASQLLPVLVQALARKDQAIFAAEQPEIHLNPKLQTMLADLFVEIAKAGKRVVIETHSEHMLLRLRRLVAEGEILPGQIALYFVERSGSRSTIREVPIEENGHIPREEWPKDFFQDALTESLALASAQASRLSA